VKPSQLRASPVVSRKLVGASGPALTDQPAEATQKQAGDDDRRERQHKNGCIQVRSRHDHHAGNAGDIPGLFPEPPERDGHPAEHEHEHGDEREQMIEPVPSPATKKPIHGRGEAMHGWEVTPQPLPACESPPARTR
jgi:hypothetical protein